jgi:uncharacterized membrane protein
MAFCPNCGASVEGRFCAKCGTAMATPTAPPNPPPANSGAAPAGGSQQAYGQQPPPYQAQPQYGQPVAAAAGGLTENVAGALCYVLGLITGIVFLVLAPYNQSKFVRFHAFQAIFFHVAWIGLIIVQTIVSFILPWSLQIIVSLLSLVIWLGGVGVWILLLVKAYQGEKFKLPVIGDLAEKQA